eukprot:TRINITY_DN10549_c0_g1_i6.p1 TRINITY_DN10549_c0_g1~~TRINITY_DN10549_c0_g1_i6.p1  ORF type:complete len:326 (+),score=87.44 TRINITY_DN10549_c0_g1_i6:650-1627(+)
MHSKFKEYSFCLKCPISDCYCLIDFDQLENFIPNISEHLNTNKPFNPNCCGVCGDLKDITTIPQCRHAYCKGCLKGYAEFATPESVLSYYDFREVQVEVVEEVQEDVKERNGLEVVGDMAEEIKQEEAKKIEKAEVKEEVKKEEKENKEKKNGEGEKEEIEKEEKKKDKEVEKIKKVKKVVRKKMKMHIALDVCCPFPACCQIIDVAKKILPLYSEFYQKVLKENALEEYAILVEEEHKVLEQRLKLQIDRKEFTEQVVYSKFKRCKICNGNKDVLEWRNPKCIPECSLGVCKLHIKECRESFKANAKCFTCGALIDVHSLRSKA